MMVCIFIFGLMYRNLIFWFMKKIILSLMFLILSGWRFFFGRIWNWSGIMDWRWICLVGFMIISWVIIVNWIKFGVGWKGICNLKWGVCFLVIGCRGGLVLSFCVICIWFRMVVICKWVYIGGVVLILLKIKLFLIGLYGWICKLGSWIFMFFYYLDVCNWYKLGNGRYCLLFF